MTNFSKELIGASSIPIILSIISRNESYGYEIIQNVKTLSNKQIEWGEGTLYPVLHKMERKGLIASYWKVGDNGRKRKYYKITTIGKTELIKEKNDWITITNIISKLWNIKPNLT